MKFNKVAVFIISMASSSVAFAADQGHGKITFNGSIIDSPCSLAPESEDQTIPLGQISNVLLKNGGSNDGQSTPRNFDIKLENCDTTTAKTVTATFTGTPSAYDADSLGVTGTAGGVSVVMTDGSGKKIKLGQPTDARPIQDGSNTLMFSAYVQGGGASAAITEGQFSTVTDFTLAYP